MKIAFGPEVISYGKHIDSEYWPFYPSISLNPIPHFFFKDTPLFYIKPNHKKFGAPLTMSKSKNKSQEKIQGFDWEQLGKKGKRDATIKEEIDSLRESYINILLSNGEGKVSEEQLTTDILPEVEHKVEDLCNRYEIDRKDQDRRKESFLSEITEFYNSYITTETYAELSIDALQIYNILNALKNIVYEVEFKLVKDHIALRFMDPSRITLVQLIITAKTYRFFKEGKVSVNLDDFAKVVKANSTEKSVTTFRFTPSEVLITKESETYRTSVHTSLSQLDLDIEEIPMEENLRNIAIQKTIGLIRKQIDTDLEQISDYITKDQYDDIKHSMISSIEHVLSFVFQRLIIEFASPS